MRNTSRAGSPLQSNRETAVWVDSPPTVKKNPPRVVLDTNLVLSALAFAGGTPAAVRHAWQQGHLTPLVASRTAAELLRVLGYPKFKLSAIEREELFADYYLGAKRSASRNRRLLSRLAATPAISLSWNWPWREMPISS